jgi:peptidyl-prolyl cis-trans isomerase C
LLSAPGTVVGKVDGSRITSGLVDAFGANIEEEMAKRGVDVSFEVNAQNVREILDEMVTFELVALEAVRQGLDRDPDIMARLAWMQRKILTEEVLRRAFTPLAPTEAEVMAYFTQHRDEFGQGLKVQWMVLPDTTTALMLLDSIRAGADFAALARRHSLDTAIAPGTYLRRSVGMALNWSLADEEAVFALQPGQVSRPIPLPRGCQLIKVLQRIRLVDNVTYNEAVQEYIRSVLQLDRQRAVKDSVVASLRSRARVELEPELYLGAAAGR